MSFSHIRVRAACVCAPCRPTAVFQLLIRVLMSVGFQIMTFPLLHMSVCPRNFEAFDSGMPLWSSELGLFPCTPSVLIGSVCVALVSFSFPLSVPSECIGFVVLTYAVVGFFFALDRSARIVQIDAGAGSHHQQPRNECVCTDPVGTYAARPCLPSSCVVIAGGGVSFRFDECDALVSMS